MHSLSHTNARTCTLTCMQCTKGHTFTAGQCDNASDLDKQPVVKVAGYKSGAGRDGLLSIGDCELLSTVSVTGKVNKSLGATYVHVSKILCAHQMLLAYVAEGSLSFTAIISAITICFK